MDSEPPGLLYRVRRAPLEVRVLSLVGVVAIGAALCLGSVSTAHSVRADSRRATTVVVATVTDLRPAGSKSVRNDRIQVRWTDTSGARRSHSIPVLDAYEYTEGDDVSIRYDPGDRTSRVFVRSGDENVMLDDAQEFTWIAGVGSGLIVIWLIVFAFWRTPVDDRTP